MILMMGNYHTVGHEEALVIERYPNRFNRLAYPTRWTITKGRRWTWWFDDVKVQSLSMGAINLKLKCENVETLDDVPVTVTGVAQCKIREEPELLGVAIEKFLGKPVKQVEEEILRDLHGHLKALLGTQNAQDISQNRDAMADLLIQVAANDICKMGMEIISCSITDVQSLSPQRAAQAMDIKENPDQSPRDENSPPSLSTQDKDPPPAYDSLNI